MYFVEKFIANSSTQYSEPVSLGKPEHFQLKVVIFQ